MSKQQPTAANIAARLLRFKMNQIDPRTGALWGKGAIPDQLLVVADGLATSSALQPNYQPWLHHLHPTVRPVLPFASVRGLSYSAAGYHYLARDTNIALLEESDQLFAPYAPQTLPVTYLAFSLGCPLLTLGLADWLRNGQQDLKVLVRQVILLQPALTLHDTFRDAVRRLTSAPQPLVDLSEAPDTVATNFFAALHTIRQSIPTAPVTMIYWPGDKFLTYDEALLKQFRASDIALVEVNDVRFPAQMTNAFEQHAVVIGQRKMRWAIRSVLEQSEVGRA